MPKKATTTMIEPKELAVIKGQVSKLENQANELTITTPEENVLATELKAKLKETGNTIKARKEAITKPLNTALKSARELFAPLEAQFSTAESIVGRKLLAYKHEVEEAARIKEAQIAARVEKGTMKVETAERKMDEVERVDKTTKTAHGQVQFRKIKKVRVNNDSEVPKQYWIIDMVAVRKDALAGIVIPGVEVYEEEIV